MGFIILIIIIVLIAVISNKINEKWYNELSMEDKTKIKELDIKLSEINPEIKNIMPKKYFLYKELYSLSKNFVNNEELMFFTFVTLTNNVNFEKGYIYVTNKKILIKTKKYEKNIPLEKISSVDKGKTMRNNWIKINDNSTTIDLNNIPKQDIEKLKKEINKGLEKHKNVSININQTTEKDISDKIARLKVLYEEGVLTEYEFNIKKLELLDKIK